MDTVSRQAELEKKSVREHKFRYLLHNLIVKRIFSATSERLQEKILSVVTIKPDTILDVSCGDDGLILAACKKFSATTCIANDLSPELTNLIKDREGNLTYTNFNILLEPFNQKFDLVFCKNTLHHIPTEKQWNLVQYLTKISHQLVIVDIEDPKKSSVMARIWNFYYRWFLGDVGDDFLSLDNFKDLLTMTQRTVTFGTIDTFKGRYMYGVM